MQAQYQPLQVIESYKMHKTLGYQFNLKYMPEYFKHLQSEAMKQLNEKDVQSIIKARYICESKLEKHSDYFANTIRDNTRAIRTSNILTQFYS
jgi:hypothetical protein